MSANTSIEWTKHTWPVMNGCRRKSEGCRHCYAERLVATRLKHLPKYVGLATFTPGGPRWSGESRLSVKDLEFPLRTKKPARIFVANMGDLFFEEVTNEEIAAVFGVMAACPQHTFQVLTKRPERALEWFKWVKEVATDEGSGRFCTPAEACRSAALDAREWREPNGAMVDPAGKALLGYDSRWPLPNVHLLTSVEDQPTLDKRIPVLLECPAAVHGVSYEPALGPADFSPWLRRGQTRFHTCVDVEGMIRDRRKRDAVLERDGKKYSSEASRKSLEALLAKGVKVLPVGEECEGFDYEKGCQGHEIPRIEWIIAGSESGPGARPAELDWFRSVRDQCVSAGVAFFFKQWTWGREVTSLPELDGRQWAEFPKGAM